MQIAEPNRDNEPQQNVTEITPQLQNVDSQPQPEIAEDEVAQIKSESALKPETCETGNQVQSTEIGTQS